MVEDVHRPFRIVSRIAERQAGVTLVLDGGVSAEPGQFVMVWLPGVEERPYAVVDDEPLTVTVQVVGPFSRALAERSEGERLWVRGPYGRGYQIGGERPLLIGGGSGPASLALLAKRMRMAGQKVVVAVGARADRQLLLVDHFDGLGCVTLRSTDDGSEGYRGSALSVAEPVLAGTWADGVYACGPEGMLRAVSQRARLAGLPCQLSLEREMKCGIGVCGHCHCGPWLVCQDGPVFNGDIFGAPMDGRVPS